MVNMVRYSTSTHSTNTDQRLVELEFSWIQEGSSNLEGNNSTTTMMMMEIQIPDSATLAPPGNWLLFVVDEGGVPSEGLTLNLNH
jgi:hypothetical protein